MPNETALNRIDELSGQLIDLNDKLWNEPEVGYHEVKAVAWFKEILTAEGFAVEGVGDMPTAFRAVYGSGKPVIGFLAEYDALPNLSQKVSDKKEPAVPGGPGHGCGHNMLGATTLGAVLGLKADMEKEKLPGTIVFYGCPAEELLTGKVFMARTGAFKELDVALAYHPASMNTVNAGGVLMALNSAKFTFKGVTAHAAADPYNGRSALDAVELMDVAANYLREHVTTDVRIHYAITDGGGVPNVVPSRAQVWYYVRAPKRESVEAVYGRLVKIAQGAAMMTDTSFEIEFQGGCYETLLNIALSEVVYDSMKSIAPPEWTPEEIALAKSLNEASLENYRGTVAMLRLPEGMQLFGGVLPLMKDKTVSAGSSDVGDVSNICPTAMFMTVCAPLGAPAHSWQNVVCAGSSIGHKGMLYGAKVMADAAGRLLRDPGLIKKAQEEFQKESKGASYVCPIPDDVPVPHP